MAAAGLGGPNGRVLWIRSEAFDHGVLHTSVHWTVAKVLDFMSCLRVALTSQHILQSQWADVATSKCKPSLSESEACAYWQIFAILQKTIVGQNTEQIDIRIIGLVLMCQVFSAYRARAAGDQANEMWPANNPATSPRVASPRRGSPRTAASAQTMVSRGRGDFGAALLTFVRQHLAHFMQIACLSLSSEPQTVSAEDFDVLGLLLRAGTTCRHPLKRLSEGVPEFGSRGGLPLRDLKKQVEKSLMWNEQIYPTTEAAASTQGGPALDIAAGETLNISSLSKTTWFQKPGIGEVDFLNITGCSECVIYITFCVRMCVISGCTGCSIVMGPVSALCTIQHCEKISVHCAARCFKIENSTDSSAYLFCEAPPILTGDTRSIKLAPYNVLCSGLTQLMESAGLEMSLDHVDKWAYPVNCTLGSNDDTLRGRSGSFFDESQASTTYHFVRPSNFKPLVVPDATGRAAGKSLNILCLPQVYEDALRERQEEMRNYHRQLMEITDEDQRRKAQAYIQGHFREWLERSGRSRQLADLARMTRMPI
eukprot:TRINITY_DN110958_c0_g1_i1.p1 TRINITY_DN110958_c0_g1~~TRINITY_DN110958_c0_g1_i1.p1  ORF type:complete len:538 (+),score=104.62 TRINITY_DN110958_c0_g1_i1:88-1701(+)